MAYCLIQCGNSKRKVNSNSKWKSCSWRLCSKLLVSSRILIYLNFCLEILVDNACSDGEKLLSNFPFPCNILFDMFLNFSIGQSNGHKSRQKLQYFPSTFGKFSGSVYITRCIQDSPSLHKRILFAPLLLRSL